MVRSRVRIERESETVAGATRVRCAPNVSEKRGKTSAGKVHGGDREVITLFARSKPYSNAIDLAGSKGDRDLGTPSDVG